MLETPLLPSPLQINRMSVQFSFNIRLDPCLDGLVGFEVLVQGVSS